jgi:radical SAM protein with 4Fe4S-binding SPASM domain
VKQWAITPKQYLQCLKDAFIEILEKQTYQRFKIDPLINIIENRNKKYNGFEFKCNKFVSLFPNGEITSCDAMREFEQKIDNYGQMFNEIIHPEYVNEQIRRCNACINLPICKGGCPPLMERYKKYGGNLLEEYCNYRVGIREFIYSYMEMMGV